MAMDSFYKSVKAILYDRITSPFYGTLIVSWLIWNWRIVYLTIFISEDSLDGVMKIDYIVEHYVNISCLVWLPLGSTVVLIGGMPVITNLAYNVSMYYNNKLKIIKQAFEDEQLLTVKESIELKMQIKNQEEKFDKLLNDKQKEIEALKAKENKYLELIDDLEKKMNEAQNASINREEYIDTDYRKIDILIEKLKNKKAVREFKDLCLSIFKNELNFELENTTNFNYFIELRLIKRGLTKNYLLTHEGEAVQKRLRFMDDD